MNTWWNQQRAYNLMLLLCVTIFGVTSCVKNSPTVPEDPPPPPEVVDSAPPPVPRPTPRPTPPPPEPEQPVIAEDDTFVSRTLEELNRESPLEPMFFGYDSSEVNTEARIVLDQNIEILRDNSNWIITIEGHCDERGTPEYNLALGERRALAARNYLVGLGLEARRVRTVSYGKEFPFEPGHDDSAWSANRRAHFVITDQ